MMETIFAWIIKKVGETAFGKMVGDALEEKFPNLFRSKTKEITQKNRFINLKDHWPLRIG